MKTNGINASARLLCGAATFLALSVTGAPVLAQEQTDEQAAAAVEGQGEDAIVVTGIRSSIQTSLDAKKRATSIVEVIAAEDLGLLPDQSIADTLARLPGVTAQRVRGRSQQISIRGLGPDFSLALLNGREVVSAGNNRGIEFDQFPSELIGSGVVYKTGDAQLAAIGIAGAVDLRTIRPLDSKKRQITASATYTINDNGSLNPDFSASGYRFFGSYIDQNDDGTIGWSLGATVQSIPTQFISRELKTNQFQVGRTAQGVIYPADNPRQGVVSREFQRTSVAGSLQFEPTDRFSLTLDGFYTNTKDSGIFRGTETPIASWSGASFVGATGTGPFADSATYSAVVPILRTDTEGADSDIYAFGGNMEWKATDNLGFVLDYGYSTLDRNDIDYESYAGTGRAVRVRRTASPSPSRAMVPTPWQASRLHQPRQRPAHRSGRLGPGRLHQAADHRGRAAPAARRDLLGVRRRPDRPDHGGLALHRPREELRFERELPAADCPPSAMVCAYRPARSAARPIPRAWATTSLPMIPPAS